ncbi:hypothetical protein [Paraburkholderia tuberum]|uniref:Uncharacterized protein n=1 Tax=Paraburkholderia tuberum TaxID=157910 RepID=A0A1H0ZPH6_9BURK|nr:hypothetical protein [Paraburkholderia tuberum]SDQ29323.1 hypothetical protein SAMN05445850_0149 [Paraburkholderia tuberum]
MTDKTLAQALYPTVGMQPDGKKIEPATVGISPKLANSIGNGEWTPWDAAPPELDQVFWNETPAASTADYNAAFDLKGYSFERPHEIDHAKKALHAMQLGTTAARAAVALYKRSIKNGRVPFTSDEAKARMLEAWGDKTDERIAEVKAYIKDAKKSYPNISAWLGESGLGNDPDFIKFVHRAAQRKKDRGHG